MKTFFVLAVILAAAAAYVSVPRVGSDIQPQLNSSLPLPSNPSNQSSPLNQSQNQPQNQSQNQPQQNLPAPGPHRSARYILLQNGGVYDTVSEVVIPANAQYVIQRGAGANRDVYIRTVPLSSEDREYMIYYT